VLADPQCLLQYKTFHWSGNQCNWNANVQVVNCGEFYLYNLPNTPVCSLRYCGKN
jgi:hypothetical protein